MANYELQVNGIEDVLLKCLKNNHYFSQHLQSFIN